MRKIGIIGRVNVGKSTLFNRLIKQRKAIVSSVAGTTRDFISGEVEVSGRKFELLDFGGMDFSIQDSLVREVNRMIMKNINSLDIILFMVDGRCAIAGKDKKISELLRKTNKKVILVVNKIDGPRQVGNIYDFYSLGFEDVVGISAANNQNLDVLLDLIAKKLNREVEGEEKKLEDLTRITIAGRPNVGKSTLFNVLCNEERSIVAEISGTTRDAIDNEVTIHEKRYLFVDTAGLRRRTRIFYILDKLATQRALWAIKNSDIILYLIDVKEGAVAYDVNLIHYALRKGKSVILIINKWDQKEKGMTEKEYYKGTVVDNSIFKRIPFIFISALKRTGIEKLIYAIERIEKASQIKISTHLLNREIKNIVVKGMGRGKIFYATQTDVRPPQILLFVNNVKLFKKRHLDFLEDNLRKHFELEGVPIIFRLRGRRRNI